MQLQVPALIKKYNSSPQYPASYGLGNDFPVEIVKLFFVRDKSA